MYDKFNLKISPVITLHAREFVHHILVYLCPVNGLPSPSEVGVSGPGIAALDIRLALKLVLVENIVSAAQFWAHL